MVWKFLKIGKDRVANFKKYTVQYHKEFTNVRKARLD
jgi:hypothetical protein